MENQETKLSQVNAILRTMSREELLGVSSLVKQHWGALSAVACAEYVPGDKVEFKGRYGQILQGVVEHVNRKTVTVKVEPSGAQWRVSAGALKKV